MIMLQYNLDFYNETSITATQPSLNITTVSREPIPSSYLPD